MTASMISPPTFSKFDVDAVRAGRGEPLASSRALVVDGGVEAELVGEPGALLVAAGDADGAAALDLGDLADHGADRAGRRRDDHRLAGLRLADVEQAEVGGRGRSCRARPSCAVSGTGRPLGRGVSIARRRVVPRSPASRSGR